MIEKPFYYLDKSVRVSVLGNRNLKYRFIEKNLRHCNICNIQELTSREQLLDSLRTPSRTHIVFMSLSDLYFKGEEFFFLKKFSGITNFFLFASKSDKPQAIFRAGQLEATYLSGDGEKLDTIFFKTLHETLTRSIINPIYNIGPYTLKKSTDILLKKSPDSVNSWAIMQNITDRALRYMWKDNIGANTKIILELNKILKEIMAYYEKIENKSSNIESSIKKANYKKTENFFHLHRRAILDYIEFNPIIPV